jgi:aspartate racemase
VHTADQYIENAVDLPFLHIVDPTDHQLIARGFSTAGLLGSRYTMTGDYFVGRLQKQYGFKVLVAEGEHQRTSTTPCTRNSPRGVSARYA